jgi:hypothetical protein
MRIPKRIVGTARFDVGNTTRASWPILSVRPDGSLGPLTMFVLFTRGGDGMATDDGGTCM